MDIESLDHDVAELATSYDPAYALTQAKMQRQLRLAILRLPVHYRRGCRALRVEWLELRGCRQDCRLSGWRDLNPD